MKSTFYGTREVRYNCAIIINHAILVFFSVLNKSLLALSFDDDNDDYLTRYFSFSLEGYAEKKKDLFLQQFISHRRGVGQ